MVNVRRALTILSLVILISLIVLLACLAAFLYSRKPDFDSMKLGPNGQRASQTSLVLLPRDLNGPKAAQMLGHKLNI